MVAKMTVKPVTELLMKHGMAIGWRPLTESAKDRSRIYWTEIPLK